MRSRAQMRGPDAACIHVNVKQDLSQVQAVPYDEHTLAARTRTGRLALRSAQAMLCAFSRVPAPCVPALAPLRWLWHELSCVGADRRLVSFERCSSLW